MRVITSFSIKCNYVVIHVEFKLNDLLAFKIRLQ